MATKQKAAIDRMVKENESFQKAIKGKGYFCFTDSHRIFTDVKETYGYPITDWESIAKYAEEFLAMSNETAPVSIDRKTGKVVTALLRSHIREYKKDNVPIALQFQEAFGAEMRKAAYNPHFIIDALSFVGSGCTAYIVRKEDRAFSSKTAAIVFKSEDGERTAIILPVNASDIDTLPAIDFTRPIEAPPTPEKEPREVVQRRAVINRLYGRAKKEALCTDCFDYTGGTAYFTRAGYIWDGTGADYGMPMDGPSYVKGWVSFMDKIKGEYRRNETTLSIQAADLAEKLKAAIEKEKATIDFVNGNNARVGIVFGDYAPAYIRAAWLVDFIRFVGEETCKVSMYVSESGLPLYIRVFDDIREGFLFVDNEKSYKEGILEKLTVILCPIETVPAVGAPETNATETQETALVVIENTETAPAAIEENNTTEKEEITMDNNEITVKVYRYGMQYRGFSPGCQPKGVVMREDDPSGLFWDIISYEEPLSWKDCQGYELTPIDHIPEGMPTEEAEEEATEPEVVIETAEEAAIEPEAAIEAPEAATETEAAIETPAEDPNTAKMAALTARCSQGFKCVGLDVGRFREKVFAVDIDGYTVTLRFAPESRAKKIGHHVLTATVTKDGQKVLVKDVGKPQARRDFEYQIRYTKSLNINKLIEKARGEEAPIEAPAQETKSQAAQGAPETATIETENEAPIETPKKEAPIKNGEKFDGLFENAAWSFEAVNMFVEYRNAPIVGKECAAFAAAMQVLGHIGEGGATPPAPIEEPQETSEEAPVEEAPAYVAAAKVDTQEARSSIDPAAVEAAQEATESTEEPQAEESPIEEENTATEPQEAAQGRYYTINEAMARRAHEMMSFREYKQGSKTAEYRAMVDEAYQLADETAKKRPDEAERIYRLVDSYARKLADNMNHDSAIGTRCPSIMISGGSNFPTRKKEKQVAAWESCHKEWQDIQGILEKIRAIGRGAGIIKSGDDNAIERLEKKLEERKALQARMVAANKAIRKKNVEQGNKDLEALGYSPKSIEELRKPDFCGRVGYPAYALQNNNAEIHRIEERLKALKTAKERGTQETTGEFFKVVENTEAMRLQLIFDDKPEPEVREILKSNGFKWAPSAGAWQRVLNGNAQYALKCVTKRLDELKAAAN